MPNPFHHVLRLHNPLFFPFLPRNLRGDIRIQEY